MTTLQSVPEDAIFTRPSGTQRSIVSALNIAAIIVAALYFGRELVMPLVLAGLLAFVLAPACGVLQKLRIPRVVCVLVVVAFTFAILGGIGMIVGSQISSLTGSLPHYVSTVEEKWRLLSTGNGFVPRLMERAGVAGTPANGAAAVDTASAFGLSNASGLVIARNVAQPLLGTLADAGVVLVFTIFILLASEDLRDRLVRLVGRRDLHRTILAMNDAARRLSRYFLFQLLLNSTFGLLIGSSLWWAGLPNPVLWAILAALMRFVPFIGTFIALAPPLLLAVAVVPGWSLAILVLALFIGAELIMGQAVEPMIYGHSTGLSPIAVIVATGFWAFLWGPVGLLLATPLTVCLVVIGRHVQPLAFLDVILGDTPPLEPAETFYQRALEGRASDLIPSAKRQIANASLAEYFDTVALPGIALAQRDLSSDALAFERLEDIHAQIANLLTSLESPLGDGRPASPQVDPDWQALGAVVCISGRGQLDDLTAAMAAQVLRASGFGTVLASNLILGSSHPVTPIDFGAVRLCCLSIVEEGSTASGIRYFVRRMQKKMPGASIVVCLWHAPGDSGLLADLRSTGESEHLVRSIRELQALITALAARRVSVAAP